MNSTTATLSTASSLFCCAGESICLDASGSEGSPEASFAAAAASLEASSPAYLLVQVEPGQYVVGLFVPPTCKPKLKMVYSSSLGGMQQQLKITPVTTLQGSEPADFSHGAYMERMDLTATGKVVLLHPCPR